MNAPNAIRCDVSTKCKAPVYVCLSAPEVPGFEPTHTCRRHVHMVIGSLIGLTRAIGIEGV